MALVAILHSLSPCPKAARCCGVLLGLVWGWWLLGRMKV